MIALVKAREMVAGSREAEEDGKLGEGIHLREKVKRSERKRTWSRSDTGQ